MGNPDTDASMDALRYAVRNAKLTVDATHDICPSCQRQHSNCVCQQLLELRRDLIRVQATPQRLQPDTWKRLMIYVLLLFGIVMVWTAAIVLLKVLLEF